MTSLITQWRAEADSIDDDMKSLAAGRYYASLTRDERAEFRVMQSRQAALRTCANELESSLDRLRALVNHLPMRPLKDL